MIFASSHRAPGEEHTGAISGRFGAFYKNREIMRDGDGRFRDKPPEKIKYGQTRLFRGKSAGKRNFFGSGHESDGDNADQIEREETPESEISSPEPEVDLLGDKRQGYWWQRNNGRNNEEPEGRSPAEVEEKTRKYARKWKKCFGTRESFPTSASWMSRVFPPTITSVKC